MSLNNIRTVQNAGYFSVFQVYLLVHALILFVCNKQKAKKILTAKSKLLLIFCLIILYKGLVQPKIVLPSDLFAEI